MLSAPSIDRLSPPALLSEARASTMSAFLRAHGDTAFLLVSLEQDRGDLRSGLMAMSAVTGMAIQPGGSGTHLETLVSESVAREVDTSIPPPHIFDEDALVALLESGPFFAVALRKRVSSDGHADRIRVGRSPATDVVLQQSGISKFHAWLEMDEDGVFYLSDSGSKNGTRVNDEPLDENEMVRVRPGDRIEFASILATLCAPETLWRALK